MSDRARLHYAGLNLLQGCLVAAIPLLLPSNSLVIDGALWALAAAMCSAAPALVFGGRRGQLYAAATCLLYWAAGTALVMGIAGSAAYLYGIYGAMGHVLGALALVLMVVMMVLFWLLPAHELVWLRQELAAPSRTEA